ncbi:MAG: hypothetical protein ACYTKD_30380, partial [Planctomycetota bacterium]
MIFAEGGHAVFKAGRQPSAKRDIMTLGIMVALVLGILAYWTLGKARKRLERDAADLPGEASETITVEEDDYRREAMRYRDLAERGEDAAAADEPREGQGAVRPIPPDDADWIDDEMRKEEAERAKFLPMLEKFTPLEYDAVRAFRALMQDRVPNGFRPKLAPPEGGGERAVVDAAPSGLTLGGPGEEKTRLAWDKVAIGDAFRIALEMTPPGSPEAGARDLIYLAQLATLAGKPDEAAKFRAGAAELHFRAELGEGAPEEARALFDAARALVDGRAADAPRSESDQDALALDTLHLSRLASSAGRASEADEYAARAVELDPFLEDEAGGRASRGLD